MVSMRSSLMKKRSKTHIEQAKEVNALGGSNILGSNSINVLHVTHEEEKDDNSWPMTKAISKSIMGYSC